MYNMAICDDDKAYIDYIKKVMARTDVSSNLHYRIYEFTSGEEFLSQLNQSINYDLLILDMKLGGIDGDETARLFRENNKDTILVFCSGSRAPSDRSFKVLPFRYLLKSYSDAQMICEIREIFAEIEKRATKQYIVGHYRKNLLRVNIKNILYVENAKRGSRVKVCDDSDEAGFEGQILIDEKLDFLAKKFPELVFAHNSYIINIDHIQKIEGNVACLDNGEYLPISRKYQKSFRENFTKNIAR